MTYYTIEFSDGFTSWIYKNTTNCISKYNTFVEAREAAELLLKFPGVTRYHINKFEQEVVRIKEKELPSKSDILHHKTRYIVQYRSNGLPGIWIDINEGEFISKDMAQWTINGSKKDSPLGDVNYRIVQRDFYYEDKEL